MIKFLIQTIKGKVKHDFAFTLLESIEYHNWLRGAKVFDYELSDIITVENNIIPIGSVQFVSEYLLNHYNIIPYPVNIPIELIDYKWTKRTVINGTNKSIIGTKFVKSATGIKSYTEICTSAPKGSYQISDIIDIDSEWRSFVYEGKLVGLQNYSGEFDIFPDVARIKEMIKAYTKQPIAFTLDVAISSNETVIIEVHDFFSCGLYGFAEHKILPFMFIKWFNQYVNKY